MAKKKAAPAKPAKTKAAPKPGKRTNWLDPASQTPLLNEYAKEMESFAKAMADGIIEETEIAEQEKEVIALMKEIEPQLSDELHEKVTRLLCEVAVYDMMQLVFSLQVERMRTAFRG